MQKEAETSVSRSCFTGQPVLLRDLRPAAREEWQRAVIVSRGGPLTYSVRLPDGRVRLAHVDHLLADGSARDGGREVETESPGAAAAAVPSVEPGTLRGQPVSRSEGPVGEHGSAEDVTLSDANRSETVRDCAEGRFSFGNQPAGGENVPVVRRSARLAQKS